jgi:PAS domain S-box-containing protein
MDKKRRPVKKKDIQPEVEARKVTAVKAGAVEAVFPIGGSSASASDLREQAEKIARKKAPDIPENLEGLSTAEASNLLHELRVHQIELEMQNEELRTAQERLEEARTQYFELSNVAPVGYFSISEKGIILEANITGANLLGVLSRELHAQPLSNFIFKDDQNVYYLHRRQLFETLAPQVYELRMVHREGYLFWAHVDATVAQDGKSGKPVCRMTIHDITEHKKTEETLRDSEAQKYAILNGISTNIALVDKELKILWANRASGDSVNKQPEDMVGHPCYSFWGDPVRPCADCPTIKAFQTGKSEHKIVQTPDGRIWDEGGEPVFDTAGNVIAVVEIAQDITERKKAEEALKESEERFRNMYNLLPQTVFETDEKGNFTFVNRQGFEMFGYSEADIAAGMSVLETIIPQDRDRAVENISQRIMGKDLPAHDYTAVRKDGSLFPVVIYASARILNSKYAGMRGVLIDISDRKQAEEALRQSEERYQRITAGLTDYLYTVRLQDGQAVETTHGQACKEVTGYTKKEFADNPNLWMNMVVAEERDQVRARVQRILAGENIPPIEHRIVRKDGQIRWVSDTPILQFDSENRLVSYDGVIKDITEHKQAEEALAREKLFTESLLATAQTIILVLDTSGHIVTFNPYMEHVSGYKLEEVKGKDWFSTFLTEDKQAKTRELFLSALSDIQTSGNIDEIVTKDGRIRTIEWYDKTLKDDNGNVVGLLTNGQDITERKRAEAALRNKQIMLERTESIAHLGSWEWDIATDTVTWSDELFRINQRDPQEGAPSFAEQPAFYHPDDFALLRQAVEVAIADGTPYALELRVIRKDGETLVCMARGAAEMGPEGRPVRLFGSLQDITQRKYAEEALRGEQWRLRSIIEGTHAGTWEWNVQTGETVFNDVWAQITGYTLDELSPISIKTWEALVHPDDLKQSDELLERHFSGELPYYDCECRMKHKDGHWVWVQDRGRIVTSTADGKPLMMFGTHSDVTVRKQAELSLAESEEKYRMVVENAQEAIVILVDGVPKFANSSSEALTGYSQEELIDKPFIEFIHPDDRQMVAERYVKRLQGLDVPNMYSFRAVCKSGDIKWAESIATPITWEEKQATLYFLTDITDRKRLEEEQQRVAKLESVGLLAGGIAHDFNNILTSILGNISLAGMEAAPGSELQNSLEQAEKASLRAKALTVQLLTFSKGGAPVLKLASLTELLKDTAGFALSGSNVKCNFSIPSDLWHAEIDAGQVSQVIHNLVINAQQAMPAGGSIDISAEDIALSETQSLGRGLPLKSGNYIRIAITDHGIGIPKDHLEKIFDPFFTTKQKGNGMGLAISFSIARQHGGHISVESELGTGSTFYLYLPASVQTSAPKGDKKEAIKPAGKARILVMDDEKGVREIAGRMLKHIGYKDIEFAKDGAEAIKMYKTAMKSGNPFNVAILDLTIAGGMGGEVTIKKLLKIDPGVKAIVSSGYIDDPVMAKHIDHGFSGVVAKPYTIEELRKAVQDVIG